MEYKILLGCPVSSRDWVLPYYLNNILKLNFNKKQIILFFLMNNITDNSKKILKQFQRENKHKYLDIILEEKNSPRFFQDKRTNEIRQEFTYSFLADLRNDTMQKCVDLGCTHYLSIDSDILVKPDLLNRLLNHNKNIVSSLIYNGYIYAGFENAYKYPNILKEVGHRQYQHIVNYRVKYSEKNPIGKLIEVDYTGACVLMTSEVCKKTKYAENVVFGEDEPWCFSARQAGFDLWCDISMYSQHIMSPELLDKFKDF